MHNSVEGKSGPVGSYQLQAVLIALCLAQIHVHANAVLGRIDLLTVMMSRGGGENRVCLLGIS